MNLASDNQHWHPPHHDRARRCNGTRAAAKRRRRAPARSRARKRKRPKTYVSMSPTKPRSCLLASRTCCFPAGCVFTRSSRAPMPAAALRLAPATADSSARSTRSTCAAVSRCPATSGSRPSSWRRGCSTGARSYRCWVAGAKPRRSASTESGRRRHRETIAPTTASRSRTSPERSTLRPTRGLFVVGGGLEYSQWDQGPGSGAAPSVEEIYTPATLPGLGAKTTYLHSEGSAALDWRSSAGYSRRGGAYGVTVNNFAAQDSAFDFRRVDYDAIQHIPLLRDAWVLSLHGRIETTYTGDGEEIPFFMLPALGGGSTLRGFSSWRFRDKHSLLMQAEWRVLANRFLDMAVFYDTGKVVRTAVGDQFRRTQKRFRPGLSAARTGGDTACASSWRKAMRALPSCSRRRPLSKEDKSCAYSTPLDAPSS